MTNNSDEENVIVKEMSLNTALEVVRNHIDNPDNGLPEDVFLFLSEISPLPNVDLLIRDERGRVLLAWRNDPWWGNGWHVPGGIVRFHESLEERIHKTALAELKTAVTYNKKPLEIQQIIDKNLKTRGHHITFVFECKVPESYKINNDMYREYETGFLKWHDFYPENMLRCHTFYRKYFNQNDM